MTINTKTFELQYPFEFRGETITSFTARRPKVIDIRKFIKAVDADSVKAMESLLADLFGKPPEVVAQIDIEDFPPMKNWAEDFLRLMLNSSPES